MKKNIFAALTVLAILCTMALLGPNNLFAHCDGIDGPVISAAKNALDTEDINLVLFWVKKKDEAELKKAFQKTMVVRKLNPEAKELADMYFFETLVRIHRAGEGEPYTVLNLPAVISALRFPLQTRRLPMANWNPSIRFS